MQRASLAAQLHAAERLRAAGERRVGLVFVVGEERGSDGAKTANTHPLAAWMPVPRQRRTDVEPARHRPSRRVAHQHDCVGRAAHSSRPELGESAIDKLIDTLVGLRAQPLPEDPLLGKTYYTIGLISGGVAPNVIPAHAEAEAMFRTVGPLSDLAPALQCFARASRSRPSSKYPPCV